MFRGTKSYPGAGTDTKKAKKAVGEARRPVGLPEKPGFGRPWSACRLLAGAGRTRPVASAAANVSLAVFQAGELDSPNLHGQGSSRELVTFRLAPVLTEPGGSSRGRVSAV